MCEEGAYYTEHFIIYCSWTRQVLEGLNLSFPLIFQSLDYKQAVIQHYIQLDEQGKMKLVLMYWSLWYARNQFIHEGSSSSIHKSVAFMQSHYAELEALNNIPSNQLVAHPGVWSPLAANIIKLNSDAHFISAINKSISDKSVISPIVNGIMAMRDFFELITFYHVGRLGNEATHELARAAVQFDLPRSWFGTVPAVVEQAARRDLAP
ncbi:hypothetical protein V6N13_108191 [Hibiscus sabdariffa]|uniref:RNase H type-1 domain-containing protein n=1 Tax=Hibiscus sabdariffa TaxID=183260 RepID=A0ABR2SSE0_9ROSI